MIAVHVPGRPIPYARSRTKSGQRPYVPGKQRDYMRKIAWAAELAMRGVAELDGPVFLQVRATYKWPKGAKAGASRYRPGRPDIDNIVKLTADSLNGIVYRDDAQIVRVSAAKVYGLPEGLTLTVSPIDEQVSPL